MAKGGMFPKGGGGGMNMNNMLKQAQALQKQMEETQKELENKEFKATSGGGAVEVIATGKKVLKDIKIKPEVLDPDDVEMVQDLILSAVNEALRLADDETSKEMGKLTGGMNLPGMF